MSRIASGFGQRIRAIRQDNKMSQEELAFKASISAAHLGQIERGEKKPTLETIDKLSGALDVTLPELFSFERTFVQHENNTTVSKIVTLLETMTETEQEDILRIIRIFRRYGKR